MALLLFVVAWLLTAIGGFVATPTMTPERSAAIGQLVGCVMWPMLLLSLAIAAVAPTRPRLAIVLAACVMVFPVGTTAFVWSLAHGSYHQPTAAERAAPTLADGADGPVLRQPALGLEFPAPIGMDLVEGDEALNEALASNAAGEHMVSWRWTSPDESRQVMVLVDIESPRSRERQREYIARVGETLSADLRAQDFRV